MKARVLGAFTATLLAIAGCSSGGSPQGELVAAAGSARSAAAPATFINRVWVVAESDQVARGALRVFLSDGTLVMASPHATPAFGTWSCRGGRLTITEEGQPYKVDILALTRDTFRIRIHSPGEPVVIRFAPAAQSTPPGAEQASEHNGICSGNPDRARP